MASRAESRLSRLNSAASSQQGPDKASVDEVCDDLLHPLQGWVEIHSAPPPSLSLSLHVSFMQAHMPYHCH